MHPIHRTTIAATILAFCLDLPADVTTLANVRASGDITVAPNGDIYASDFGNPSLANGNSVVLVKPDGTQSLFVSNLPRALEGNDIDPQGNLIQVGFSANVVYRINSAGNATTIANLAGPVGVVVDDNGAIYVTQCQADSISRIESNGSLTLIASGGGLDCPNGLDFGHDGALYVVNNINGGMLRVGLDGSVSAFATIPGNGNGHVVYVNDHYYVAGRLSHRIYEVDTSGNVVPFAGTGVNGNADGPNLEATISRPNGIGASPDGRYLYIIGGSNFSAPTLPLRRIDLLPEDSGFDINIGMAGSWYNPDTDGQGLFLDVLPATQEIFLAWFTYLGANSGNDSVVGSADHKWYIAFGEFQHDTADLQMSITDGGVFDDPAAVSESPVGSMTLEFASCTEATMTYAFDDGGPQGEISLVRLTPDELCDTLAASQ